ncbi:hypothetical protein QGN29_04275 [Temperatibacter marinus]|uniref:Uncharacterized protein n=1 Tax=Temperatibacter marinus TaxID=1456591 RepID=A0AA52EJE1_9PROT|nr:hypothetical protein [Temperatibacter marinus]WND03589.1 hypothetical protein QGN29_04275 [Temperatibacter marinus]
MSVFIYLVLIILTAVNFPSLAEERESSCYLARKFTEDKSILSRFQKLYKSKGMCIKFLDMSYPKATSMFKYGNLDIDFARVAHYGTEENIPVVKINPAWITNEGMLVCRQGISCTSHTIPQLTVGSIRNTLWSKKFAVKAKKSLIVNNAKSLIRLIENERVDAILLSSFFKDRSFAKPKIPHTSIVLQNADIHIWVHKDLKQLFKVTKQIIPDIKLTLSQGS